MNAKDSRVEPVLTKEETMTLLAFLEARNMSMPLRHLSSTFSVFSPQVLVLSSAY